MSELPLVDLRGLKCPTPIVRLNDEIGHFGDGEEFAAVADDRAFELDVRAWCDLTGHELVDVSLADGSIRARIRRVAT